MAIEIRVTYDDRSLSQLEEDSRNPNMLKTVPVVYKTYVRVFHVTSFTHPDIQLMLGGFDQSQVCSVDMRFVVR